MKYIIPEAKFIDLKSKLKSWMVTMYRENYYSKLRKWVNKYLNLCNHFYTDEKLTLTNLIEKYFGGSNKTFYIWAAKIIDCYQNNNFDQLHYKSTRPLNIKYHYPLKIRKKICNYYYGYKNLRAGGVLSLYHNLHQGDIHEVDKNVIPKSLNTFYNWIRQDKRFKLIKEQIRKSKRQFKRYEVKELGLLQMDAKIFTHEKFPIKNKRLYVYDFIDEKTRIAFGYVYDCQSVTNAIDAVNKALFDYKKLGINIKRIRTDNGGEFTTPFKPKSKYINFINIRAFTSFLIQNKIIHETTPIRSPQSNGKIERFHRNYNNLFWLNFARRFDIKEMQSYLNEWYVFYNFKRRHKSLKFKTPFEALNKFGLE